MCENIVATFFKIVGNKSASTHAAKISWWALQKKKVGGDSNWCANSKILINY